MFKSHWSRGIHSFLNTHEVGRSADSDTVVQFCCGSGDCTAAGVPWGKRQDSTDLLGAGSGLQVAFLQFSNGTIVPPLEIGSPPELSKR